MPSKRVQDKNRLSLIKPAILKYWDYDKNVFSPEDYSFSSAEKVWLKCELGHSYQKAISGFKEDRSHCPYCCGQKILTGFNDLSTTHPEVAPYWSDKNALSASKVSAGSHKKAWFKCFNNLDHEFYTSIKSVCYLGTRCPYCANQKILTGFNDVLTLVPEVKKIWSSKNTLKLNEIGIRNTKTAIFECKNGHEWKTSVRTVAERGCGCPYCSNRYLLQGWNDVESQYPEVLEFWDYDKNTVMPNEVKHSEERRVFWKCGLGHEWDATIYQVCRVGTRCPVCERGKQSSNMERELADTVRAFLDEDCEVITNTFKIIPPYELDIFVPALGVAFEFNGAYWHSDEVMLRNRGMRAGEFHDFKSRLCEGVGVRLVHVGEEDWVGDRVGVLGRIECVLRDSNGVL